MWPILISFIVVLLATTAAGLIRVKNQDGQKRPLVNPENILRSAVVAALLTLVALELQMLKEVVNENGFALRVIGAATPAGVTWPAACILSVYFFAICLTVISAFFSIWNIVRQD